MVSNCSCHFSAEMLFLLLWYFLLFISQFFLVLHNDSFFVTKHVTEQATGLKRTSDPRGASGWFNSLLMDGFLWKHSSSSGTVSSLFIPINVVFCDTQCNVNANVIHFCHSIPCNSISGTIVVYIVYPLLVKTKGKLDFIQFIGLRWLRFTPSLVGIMMIYFLWPLIGSGPIFKEKSRALLKPCYQYWWKNFFYINNWVTHHQDIVSFSPSLPLIFRSCAEILFDVLMDEESLKGIL